MALSQCPTCAKITNILFTAMIFRLFRVIMAHRITFLDKIYLPLQQNRANGVILSEQKTKQETND
ncbi:MAG: hypothetical protein BHV84_04490 [Prevotella sp. AG:487_50_53]|nr:MAG: hypothetical protein BHV84_04490 [Prevotella sp. AG:487_50_53]